MQWTTGRLKYTRIRPWKRLSLPAEAVWETRLGGNGHGHEGPVVLPPSGRVTVTEGAVAKWPLPKLAMVTVTIDLVALPRLLGHVTVASVLPPYRPVQYIQGYRRPLGGIPVIVITIHSSPEDHCWVAEMGGHRADHKGATDREGDRSTCGKLPEYSADSWAGDGDGGRGGPTREDVPARLKAYEVLREDHGEFVCCESLKETQVPDKAGGLQQTEEMQKYLLDYDVVKSAQDCFQLRIASRSDLGRGLLKVRAITLTSGSRRSAAGMLRSDLQRR
ncbi:hypothetical protein C8R44DRAFT_753895 [Mycena epipterygia]|nr:hypothetical protein C8R44DRAFT_753895 [Mycena epipterygia]